MRFWPRCVEYEVTPTDGTVLVMYGRDHDHCPSGLIVTGIDPTMYLLVPSTTSLDAVVETLNAVLTALLPSLPVSYTTRTAIAEHGQRPIRSSRLVTGIPSRGSGPKAGYVPLTETSTFLQLWLYSPKFVPIVRKIAEYVTPTSTVDELVRCVTRKDPRDETVATTGRAKVGEAKAFANAAAISGTWDRPDCLDDDHETADDADEDDGFVEEDFNVDVGGAGYATGPVGASGPLDALLGLEVFEADMDYTLRAFIDMGIVPEEWLEVDNPTRRVHAHAAVGDVSYVCAAGDVRRAPDDVQLQPPRQQCVSVDAETEMSNGTSLPEVNQVYQICCVVFDPTADPDLTNTTTYAFVLGSIDVATMKPETRVQSFSTDRDLLLGYARFMRALKPDMITGWNVEGFDYDFFLRRARVLGIGDEFGKMTRDDRVLLRATPRTFTSGACGSMNLVDVKGPGVWVWDLLPYFMRSPSYQFGSYKLNDVSIRILGEFKQDVGYAEMNALQTTEAGRTRLMNYCIQDAFLVARILTKLHFLTELQAIVRNTGVTVDMAVRRGMQIRSKTSLYRELSLIEPRFFITTRTDAERAASRGTTYEGGYVFEAQCGLFLAIVLVLDFKSLYPSIVITFNLCPTTRLTCERARAYIAAGTYRESDFTWFPELNVCFIKAHIHQGIIPRVLKNLLRLREEIKAKMKREPKGSHMRILYDKQQAAIKINANAIYGAAGASVAFWYCVDVAAATTAMGRKLIQASAAFVTSTYTRANGHDFDATIIYGDTDSIMVKLDDATTLEQAYPVGMDMAHSLTELFRSQYDSSNFCVEMEFEKIFWPYLLQNKKKYGDAKWIPKDGQMVFDCIESSGLENVRRDAPKFAADTIDYALRTVLDTKRTSMESRLEAVRTYVQDEITKLRTGRMPIHRVKQSMQIRKPFAVYAATGLAPPPHVMLADKMAKRYGAGPKPGERVDFVITAPAELGKQTSECAEEPWYAWDHGQPLHMEHYVDRCLLPMMGRFFEPILLGNVQFFSKGERQKAQLNAARDFVYREAKRLRVETVGQQQHMSGVKRRRRCPECGVPTTEAVCPQHSAAVRAQYDEALRVERETILAERAKLWAQCQKCAHKEAAVPPVPDVEDLNVATPCESTTCPIYSERRMNDRLSQAWRQPSCSNSSSR